MTGRFILIMALFASAAWSEPSVTAVFPAKNGTFPADMRSAPSLQVDGAHGVLSWLSFNVQDFGTKMPDAAILLLPLQTVRVAGTCGAFALIAPVTPPEAAVREHTLHFDDMPIAATNLDSSSADGMILLDITEQVRSRAFFGIAIRAMGRLSAEFSSRTATPAPAVICIGEDAAASPHPHAKWFTGNDRPGGSLGKPGDFYAQQVQGVIFRKSGNAWDSLLTLTAPPPPPVAAKRHKTTTRSTRKSVSSPSSTQSL
jgi:hypothetical protein